MKYILDETKCDSKRPIYLSDEALAIINRTLELQEESSHKIRKTVLTTLFDKGFDIEEVMKIAGHKHKTTTLKSYLLSRNRRENKRERMSNALQSKHCPFGQPQVNPRLTA